MNWLALATFGGAVVADRAIGEWPNAVHPVVWMGKMIALLERIAPSRGPRRQLVAGAVMTALVPATFASGAFFGLRALRPYPVLFLVAGVLLLKSTFALKALSAAARHVESALREGALGDARYGLRSLCSRDPSRLEAPQLVAATIESVAENASDSFVAPLFYFALFGVPGAVFYRAVNTLDSMIGYHGKYEYLGKIAAKLDDVLNWIPARITAGLLLLAGFFRGKAVRQGWLIWRRDAHLTESPNAGRPMAVMAGILGVELEKEGHYRLGDPLEPLSAAKIEEACTVLDFAAALGTSVTFLIVGARYVYP